VKASAPAPRGGLLLLPRCLSRSSLRERVVVRVTRPASVVRIRRIRVLDDLQHARQQLAIVGSPQPDHECREARILKTAIGHLKELSACSAQAIRLLLRTAATAEL